MYKGLLRHLTNMLKSEDSIQKNSAVVPEELLGVKKAETKKPSERFKKGDRVNHSEHGWGTVHSTNDATGYVGLNLDNNKKIESPHQNVKTAIEHNQSKPFGKNEEFQKPKIPHLLFTTQKPRFAKVKNFGNNEVIDALTNHGFKAIPIKGKYGKEENGIMVINPPSHKVRSILNFVKDLGQDSALYSDGENHELHILNGEHAGKHYKGNGTQWFNKKPSDYYTTTDNKHFFSHNISFDKHYPSEHSVLEQYGESPWNKGKAVPYRKDEGDDFEKNENFPGRPKVQINPEHGRQIADAYEQMKHDPEHPDVKAAYGALIDETKKQYQNLLDSGLKISKIPQGQPNPYPTSKHLHDDVDSGHMWYYPTDQGFGSGDVSKDHPMLQPTEFKDNEGKPMLANDCFRVVHDKIHHNLRNKFGAKGEHEAYIAHKKTFSPLAQKALATETMGQNSWVNYSTAHGEHNRKNPTKTIFADQKAGLLPDHILNAKWHGEE